MQEYTEYVGYAASLAVLVSFLMKKMKPLRMINIVGCGLFVTYGAMLGSIPVIITNAAICCVHIFYLTKKGGN
ncbi:MAG: YgjV family protein [Bacteroidota bacterium]